MRIRKEYMPQTQWAQIRGSRRGRKENEGGDYSTHRMRHEQLEDGTWVAFPSLFQNKDGEWKDMSEQANENWVPVYEEAKRRGEVYSFGEDKDAAEKFSLGEWKEKEPQTVTGIKEYIPKSVREEEEYIPQRMRDEEEYIPQSKR